MIDLWSPRGWWPGVGRAGVPKLARP